MQTECLNEKCSKEVSDGNKWCSMECKKDFLLSNYSDGQCGIWFSNDNRKFELRQKKVRQEIKDSGLSVSEFIESLGEFKDDEGSVHGIQDRNVDEFKNNNGGN